LDGNWIGLIELGLVAAVVLGWAFYELRSLRTPSATEKSSGQPDQPPSDEATAKSAPPRHPEGQ
jgi:hypothetical protein